MTMKIQKIKKINEAYVRGEIAQIMMPYKEDYLTILSSSGILYHSSTDNHYQNEYLTDYRRYQFPYYNIPIHREMKNGHLITYVNEIYELGKSYIVLKEGKIIQDTILKTDENQKSAIYFQKVLEPKLEHLSKCIEIDDINKTIREYIGSISGKHFIFSNGGVLSDNITYQEKNKHKIIENESKLIITINEDIISSIKGIKIYKKNHVFDFMVFDFRLFEPPVNIIKYMEKDASTLPEPKIKRRLNPGVTRQAIINAKTMARLKD